MRTPPMLLIVLLSLVALGACAEALQPDGGRDVPGAVCNTGETRPCFDGVPAYRNTGACHDGTQTCSVGFWSVCNGEVLPAQAEVCGNHIDDDCNGMADDHCASGCGDHTCSTGETCSTCPTDCGTCSGGCGDHVCAASESCASCPGDCGACPSCSGNTACISCLGVTGCGFCTNDGTCHAGNASAPADSACSGSNWVGTATSCPNSCSTATTCAACTGMGQCGWCANDSHCHLGTDTGATDGACTGTNWSWLSSTCPGTGACAASSCAACTAMGTCGWCKNNHTCGAGTSTGPTSHACSGTNWAWLSSACN